MMFRCISNFKVNQDEFTLSDRVYTQEERQAIKETREAGLLLENLDVISDDEEPTSGTQFIIQVLSQHALRKRRKSIASISDIDDGNDDNNDDDDDDDGILLPLMQEEISTQTRMAIRNQG